MVRAEGCKRAEIVHKRSIGAPFATGWKPEPKALLRSNARSEDSRETAEEQHREPMAGGRLAGDQQDADRDIDQREQIGSPR